MEAEVCLEWEEWKHFLQVIKSMGSKQGHGDHKIQTCDSKGVVKSSRTYGAYCIAMDQDHGRGSKDRLVQVLRNGKMCKDKWNGWNSHYKKLSNCHKGTSHHTSF